MIQGLEKWSYVGGLMQVPVVEESSAHNKVQEGLGFWVSAEE